MVRYLHNGFAKFLFFLVVLVAFEAYNTSFAQANFTAICPQKKIGKNDYLQVQFKVEHAANVESIDPPSFKNFSVVSGPNQESGMTSINGKVDQYVSIGYVLKPNGPGKFTIAPATAKADGKEFQSNTLNVEVTNSSTASSSSSSSSNNPANSLSAFGGSNPFANLNFDFPTEPVTHQFDDYILKKGENVTDKVKKNLFIKLDVSKTSCYVGEPITASFKLYTRLRSESTITDAPSFNGFSVSEMELNNNNSSGVEKYNGRDYNVYTLRKVQLYPLQPGKITLDPLVADNKVTFIKADYASAQGGDMFLDMMQNFADATAPRDAIVEQHVTLQSKPVEITVKPLPDENKPADFKGSVGNFSIQSSLQKNEITTDDAGNLRIIISGAGNIQLINAPKISWPQGVDGYDAKITDHLDKYSVPLKGSKTFTYPFTVSKPGTYTIPAVSFSFFDPALATYKTLSTQPLVVTITKGKGIPNNPYLKNKIVETPTSALSVVEKYALYFIIGLISLAGIIFWIFKRNNAKNKPSIIKTETESPENNIEKEEPAFVIPESPLGEAHQQLAEENSAAFYRVLDASLKKYLSAKFKVPAEELNKKRINEELDKCNVGLGTSLRLTSLMDNIELNLYAPPSNVNQLKEVYEKASEVVSLLDKQVC
ncbi:MAG TPA: BatD family protein [Ginsengibacter sp.]|nr:BatD family protein [Ginsengibacter sp.]